MKINKDKLIENSVKLIILLLIFAFIFYQQLKKDNRLFSIGKYTVGTITHSNGMKGGVYYYYEFTVDNKLYKSGRKSGGNKAEGKRFYVVYNPKKPDNCEILFLLPKIPDSIKPPKNGWERKLININDEKIINAINGNVYYDYN